MIRCKVCGYTTTEFHGWVFTTSSGCSGEREGWKSMLHVWEPVK